MTKLSAPAPTPDTLRHLAADDTAAPALRDAAATCAVLLETFAALPDRPSASPPAETASPRTTRPRRDPWIALDHLHAQLRRLAHRLLPPSGLPAPSSASVAPTGVTDPAAALAALRAKLETPDDAMFAAATAAMDETFGPDGPRCDCDECVYRAINAAGRHAVAAVLGAPPASAGEPAPTA